MTSAQPPLADWEKHTKGIGSKLLQKFGFKGRLGAKEDGISAAIEVNVRPSKVGLGFGDADAPKASKEDKEKDKEKRAKKKLSLAEQQAESQAWKRSRSQQESLSVSVSADERRRKNTTADSFMREYEAMLAGDGAARLSAGPVIDMRGAEAKVLSDLSALNEEEEEEKRETETGKPRLGAELLYNLTAMLDLEKSRVTSTAKQLHDERHTRTRIEQQIAALRAQELEAERKAQRLQEMEQELRKMQEALSSSPLLSEEHCAAAMQAVIDSVQRVHRRFPDEFAFYGVSKLLPGLLAKIVAPLRTSFAQSPLGVRLLSAQWRELALHFEGEGLRSVAGECTAALQQMAEKELLPQTRRFLASQWDPVRESEKGVEVIETLRPLLSPSLFEEIVQVSLLPRLSSAVQSWSSTAPEHPLHVWLHPWLPLLGSQLSSLYPEVRRKLVSAMRSWHAHDTTIISHIAPWLPVFDATSSENFLSKTVLPKLVEWLRQRFVVNPAAQSTEEMEVLLQWEVALPRHQFVLLFAGEVLPKWVRALLLWLSVSDADLREVCVWYEGWMSWLPHSVLQDEEHVLPIISFALDVMRESALLTLRRAEGKEVKETNWQEIHSHTLAAIERADYYVLARDHFVNQRFKEKLQTTRAAAATTSGWSSSLKDILTMYAEQHGLEFKPKFGKVVEGKAVWEFGPCQCYFDSNVVFVLQTSTNEWIPRSIEDLLAQCQQGP